MLRDQGVLTEARAVRLLRAIRTLERAGFAPLRAREAPRGWYLRYESYLIDKEGPEIGGQLQTARSRNDLNATLAQLSARQAFARLSRALLRLQVSLLRRAARFRAVTMPVYTHGQPAEPITYGHYLAGVAEAVERDIAGLLDAARGLERCPLGAAAAAGTALPIDAVQTARSLGFLRPVRHSLDAVASRDALIRLLAAAAIASVTLSRAACDLLQWATNEFALIRLPDHLVGSSSAMPQKRNPFVLEHVQGLAASLTGALTTMLAAVGAAPFTNSVIVGTEAIKPFGPAMADAAKAATLLRLVIADAQPDPERMRSRATHGLTSATALAVRVMADRDLDYRSAHHLVGRMIRDRGELGAIEELVDGVPHLAAIDREELRVDNVAARAELGGGPGPRSLQRCLDELRQSWKRHAATRAEMIARWSRARHELYRTVDAILQH
jgi:argininosuccinate lyase